MNKKKWRQKFSYKDSTRFLKHNPPRRSALHGRANEGEQILDIMEQYRTDEAEWREQMVARSWGGGRRKADQGMDRAVEPPRSYRWRGLLAVREAREITAHRMYQGHTALKLLELMYWPKNGAAKLTCSRAAAALGLRKGQAKRMHLGFLRLVEERYMLRRDEVW